MLYSYGSVGADIETSHPPARYGELALIGYTAVKGTKETVEDEPERISPVARHLAGGDEFVVVPGRSQQSIVETRWPRER
jgi:hypothetical protein